MGAAPRYPYPKQVWSPAGGWWSRPANWKSNTVIAGLGCTVFIAYVWKASADREVRHQHPSRWIPSMMWAKQYRDLREN
ncbi:hypothetical protein K493DRAFT_317983 [Basidiobolus meristosporus CBS 931.73]|uniref:Uncharacterized protein n=1 Tax=Basidiobolus meristosporus CBS 931.73 TaxID=1314790 RepID=A0A1Y1VVL0_9FUNG|nr:hypothetical protein K493DRAFT_7477 [Basidiobolus meristosporus CBS 931.73]ORX90413.1 hypothetical protein K493DRAFT_317983 [Basidiobolus meristosporus CBS 931.73]|eukprot:ORX65310.1 hypothetical protein K493DRAFT_7477 [Basidiobolus meristosporus CBS 931.73]